MVTNLKLWLSLQGDWLKLGIGSLRVRDCLTKSIHHSWINFLMDVSSVMVRCHKLDKCVYLSSLD